MSKSYLIATVAGLLLALGGAAQAGGHGLGVGGGQPTAPPGFGSGGGHEGFSSTTSDPKGWTNPDSKADWKTDATQPLPPGFTGTNSKPDLKP